MVDKLGVNRQEFTNEGSILRWRCLGDSEWPRVEKKVSFSATVQDHQHHLYHTVSALLEYFALSVTEDRNPFGDALALFASRRGRVRTGALIRVYCLNVTVPTSSIKSSNPANT